MKQSNKILIYGLIGAFIISIVIGVGVRIKSELESKNNVNKSLPSARA